MSIKEVKKMWRMDCFKTLGLRTTDQTNKLNLDATEKSFQQASVAAWPVTLHPHPLPSVSSTDSGNNSQRVTYYDFCIVLNVFNRQLG